MSDDIACVMVHCACDAMVPIGEIKPHPLNPNTHPQGQVEMLAKTIIVERATPSHDQLFHAICCAPRLNSAGGTWRQRLSVLRRNFDLSPILRRYEIDEPHPAWFLSSYTHGDRLRSISASIERKIPIDATVTY